MTDEQIIGVAKKAGFLEKYQVFYFTSDELQAFAKLVAQNEREAIYQLVMEAPFKELDRQQEDFDGESVTAMKAMAFSLTSAIRARGEA